VELRQIAEIAFALAWEMGIPVTRFISRPFVRLPGGGLQRSTAKRHDVPLPIGHPILVDMLRHHGVWTTGVGKIGDLTNEPGQASKYNQEWHLSEPQQIDPALGLRFVRPGATNPYSLQGTVDAIRAARTTGKPCFIMTNFVDGDSLDGHTTEEKSVGGLDSLQEVDRVLPQIEAELPPGAVIILTADHGMEHRNDLGYHSIEDLPLLAVRVGHKPANEGLYASFNGPLTEVGAMVAREFGCEREFHRGIVHIPAVVV
jgi:phosphopentomutase